MAAGSLYMAQQRRYVPEPAMVFDANQIFSFLRKRVDAEGCFNWVCGSWMEVWNFWGLTFATRLSLTDSVGEG